MHHISPETYTKFDATKIIFEPAKHVQSAQGHRFQRISLRYNYSSGPGALVVQTPILFSYGVSTGVSADSTLNKENPSPQLSLVAYNADTGPTKEESNFITVCNKILIHVKEHLKTDSTKEELDKWDMETHLEGMKIFYVKKEKGKPVKGCPPVLYAKLYYKLQQGKPVITSRIDNAITGEPISLDSPLGRSKVYATVIFNNIYIGAKPSIQMRIGEVMVVEQVERKSYLSLLTQTEEEGDEPCVSGLLSCYKPKEESATRLAIPSSRKPKK